MLLAGLATHLFDERYDYVIGCASVNAADDPLQAAAVADRLVRNHLGPDEWRVLPRCPFAVSPHGTLDPDAPLPPLIKGYLRLGARVCGPPAWDAQFRRPTCCSSCRSRA